MSFYVYSRHKYLPEKEFMRKEPLEYDPVIHGYSVAIGNEYDITSIRDVVKILKWINHEDISEKYAEEFSKQLLAFDFFLHRKLDIKGKITADKLIEMGLVKRR